MTFSCGLLLLGPSPALAQAEAEIDALGMPMPLYVGDFASARSAHTTDGPAFKTRLSYLADPIELRIPSASTEGTRTSAVEGTTILELSGSVGRWKRWEAGIGLGMHLYQWGNGLDAVTGASEGLMPVGFRDPRLEVSYQPLLEPLAMRLYVGVWFPFGTQRAFAGEGKTRLEFGASIEHQTGRLFWVADTGALIRPQIDFGQAAWGTQIRFSTGLLIRLVEGLLLGPELFLAPIISSQPSSESRVFPAEALGTIQYRRQRWSLKASAGSGLPLSRWDPGGTPPHTTRAPTSPRVRALLEFNYSLSKPTQPEAGDGSLTRN